MLILKNKKLSSENSILPHNFKYLIIDNYNFKDEDITYKILFNNKFYDLQKNNNKLLFEIPKDANENKIMVSIKAFQGNNSLYVTNSLELNIENLNKDINKTDILFQSYRQIIDDYKQDLIDKQESYRQDFVDKQEFTKLIDLIDNYRQDFIDNQDNYRQVIDNYRQELIDLIDDYKQDFIDKQFDFTQTMSEKFNSLSTQAELVTSEDIKNVEIIIDELKDEIKSLDLEKIKVNIDENKSETDIFVEDVKNNLILKIIETENLIGEIQSKTLMVENNFYELKEDNKSFLVSLLESLNILDNKVNEIVNNYTIECNNIRNEADKNINEVKHKLNDIINEYTILSNKYVELKKEIQSKEHNVVIPMKLETDIEENTFVFYDKGKLIPFGFITNKKPLGVLTNNGVVVKGIATVSYTGELNIADYVWSNRDSKAEKFMQGFLVVNIIDDKFCKIYLD